LITFFSEDISFTLQDEQAVNKWLNNIVKHYNKSVNYVNYIFCNDIYLLNLNKKYLNHDTMTDIITFQYNEQSNNIESDIFISIERVKENATKFGVAFEEEILRVMVHGLLHIFGYNDKSQEDRNNMRTLETKWISTYRK
jgi:probable rRNA maturation factor